MAAECAPTFGQAAELVCQRLAEMGWSPAVGAGWFSTLAAVMAGFVFSAIVIVLTPQSPFKPATKAPVDPSHSLPVFLGSFLSLLSASFLYVLVSSEGHPAKVMPAAGLAAAVFGAGAVQTFVAIAWLAVTSPLPAATKGCLSVAARFVMFSTGLHVLVSVVKAQWILTGDANASRITFAVFLLAGPWLATRVLVRPGSLIARWNGRLQVLSFKLSISFVGLASVAFMFTVDRGNVSPGQALPDWLAFGTLLALGLIYAVHEVNLPSPAMQTGLAEGSAESREDDAGIGGDEVVTSIQRLDRRKALAGL